ncbi:Protein kinase, ATP binding site-containing protein [Cynara cardunculus var. scolymus]|uniref:Protein kinase, ATP binding site-containing protein n=1 Tax=Cynara cardunculus var. scolymus TaxID=59895 RepID=A0A103XYP7_CYNCS|nr:Protein kinase, ATP binding site-containing protein [Cynara cardunculus var. scolymus]
MGCVTSKQTVSVTPAVDHSGAFRDNAAAGSCRSIDGNGGGGGGGDVVAQLENNKKSMKKKKNARSESGVSGSELGESGRTNWTIGGGGGAGESVSFRLGNMHRYVEVEQVAAGWPAWLSAVAGEAIHGWVPLRAESFEKLEKVGQGTYSSVFRARDLEAGKIVALKKVRFDNFEPESVRFMAREIVILRRLSHPNIMKLDGIITSQLSCSIYLIKCYMKQLLSGLAHCHSRGVMHRDIKGANLLVNNEGVMKIGDFGLANFCNVARDRRPLTSKVVTLWYRPPELLLGSTDYDASVDLWSIGCVFAELLRGVPVLQGRTEVEQMHKIFKLCGSPCDDYWKRSKLPHATLFKPQLPYESHLPETFNDLPKNTVDLIETLLSIEPYKRGTASSALASENLPARTEGRHKIVETSLDHKKDNDIILGFEPRKPFVNTTDRASQGDIPFSGPLQVSGSSGFAWARRRFNDSSTTRSRSRSSSKSLVSESSVTLHPREPKHSEKIERTGSRGRDSKVKNWSHLELDGPSDGYPSQYPSIALFKKIDLIYQNQEDKVEFSGPLLTQSHQIDELLERHERQVRQAVRRSWLQRGRKNG